MAGCRHGFVRARAWSPAQAPLVDGKVARQNTPWLSDARRHVGADTGDSRAGSRLRQCSTQVQRTTAVRASLWHCAAAHCGSAQPSVTDLAPRILKRVASCAFHHPSSTQLKRVASGAGTPRTVQLAACTSLVPCSRAGLLLMRYALMRPWSTPLLSP